MNGIDAVNLDRITTGKDNLTMKKSAFLLLPLLFIFLATAALAYEHDPRLNPTAMRDIVVDPDAVYGFSPSPDGSLSAYVEFDWTDPALVNGENGRLARIAYHESINDLYILLDDMRAAGCSTEEIARAVSTRRNEIRLASYDGNPDGLAAAKARNLEKYGHEEGPLPDELFAQYGSWEEVIWKAFSANPGMDACLGLYDDYYALYTASGMIDEEEEQPASREYAASVLAETFGLPPASGDDSGRTFGDFDEVSSWYADSVKAAVSAGIMRGYEDGTLRSRQTVTRLEAYVLFARCLSDDPVADDVSVPSDVPLWASGEIAFLVSEGIFGDMADISWDEPLTVAAFRKMIQSSL